MRYVTGAALAVGAGVADGAGVAGLGAGLVVAPDGALAVALARAVDVPDAIGLTLADGDGVADFAADAVAVVLALADALGEGRVDGVAVADGDGDGDGVVSARAETAARSEKRSTPAATEAQRHTAHEDAVSMPLAAKRVGRDTFVTYRSPSQFAARRWR